ncbi:hypothetical protein, partial [Staphylococcus aureus]
MYELISMHGLPKNRKLCEQVLEYTDTKRNELLDCTYGETVYVLIRDFIRSKFSEFTDERPEAQEYYL